MGLSVPTHHLLPPRANLKFDSTPHQSKQAEHITTNSPSAQDEVTNGRILRCRAQEQLRWHRTWLFTLPAATANAYVGDVFASAQISDYCLFGSMQHSHGSNSIVVFLIFIFIIGTKLHQPEAAESEHAARSHRAR